MNWRPLGAAGEPYPAWVRALQKSKSSGVYAIRRRGWVFQTVLYVGESHTGNLYSTLTRHFQAWSRGGSPKRKFWQESERYAPRQTDPGHTYERAAVEVAVRTGTRAQAVQWQADWIKRLSPTDNVQYVEPLEEVPF